MVYPGTFNSGETNFILFIYNFEAVPFHPKKTG